LTPEELAERRIAAVRCEHEGGKAYHNGAYYSFECVSAREQQRLERLELACVSAGGTPIYSQGNRKYVNCNQRGPDQININNSNNNSSSSTIKRY